VNGFSFLAKTVPFEGEELKLLADQLIEKQPKGILLLATKTESNCQIIVRIGDEAIKIGLKAPDFVAIASPIIEGKGGGKPQQAQVGGKSPEKLQEAFTACQEFVISKK